MNVPFDATPLKTRLMGEVRVILARMLVPLTAGTLVLVVLVIFPKLLFSPIILNAWRGPWTAFRDKLVTGLRFGVEFALPN